MADAQKLKIDATALADLALVLGEHRLGIGGEAVRHMGVFRLDVDVVKKVFLHEAAIALLMIRRKPLVFVQIERAHAGKVDPPRLVAGNELTVERKGCGTGRQSQHAGGFGVDLQFKDICGKPSHVLRGFQRNHFDSRHFDSLLKSKMCILSHCNPI